MSSFSVAKEELSRISWLQLLVYMEFVVAAVIVIFTAIGLAIGQTVAMLFLLAFLQFLIAIPGCVYSTQHVRLFFFVYMGAQTATGACELVWFIVHLVGGGSWPPAVVLIVLAIVQTLSVVLALTCGEKPVVKKKQEAEVKVEATKSDVEKATKSQKSSGHSEKSKKMATAVEVKKQDETATSEKEDNEQQQQRSKRSQRDQVSEQSLSSMSKEVREGQRRLKEIRETLAQMNAKESKIKELQPADDVPNTL